MTTNPHTLTTVDPMTNHATATRALEALPAPPRTVDLTTRQAADYLGIHFNTIKKWTRLPADDPRHLPARRLGDHTNGAARRIALTDLERWARTHLPDAPAPWDDTPRPRKD